MKKCNSCGTVSNDDVRFCTNCGSNSFSSLNSDTGRTQPSEFHNPTAYTPPAYTPPAYTPPAPSESTANPADNVKENILSGVVGAFLFSLIGVVLYIVLYQFNIIAGICGLVTFVLASFGYGVFGKAKNNISAARIVTAVIVTIVMIFAAEYCCLTIEIYKVYSDFGISIFDAISATPDFFATEEIFDAVMHDLLIAYAFSFIATIGSIIGLVRTRKK